MKKQALLGLIMILFSISTLSAQDVPVEFVNAFKKGSAQELSRYLGDKVDMVILNRPTNADKTTAEKSLADFFNRNKVSNFTVNHQGKRDESSFMIGTLVTSNGNFRVNCFFKRSSGGFLIYQIRIDKTNE